MFSQIKNNITKFTIISINVKKEKKNINEKGIPLLILPNGNKLFQDLFIWVFRTWPIGCLDFVSFGIFIQPLVEFPFPLPQFDVPFVKFS